MALPKLSPEEMALMQEKAKETREAKKKAGEHLQQDFGTDEKIWRELASAVGFRLAAKHIPCSEVKYAKRLLKHLGKDIVWWQEINGLTRLSDFAKYNPDWPAYSLQGLILEDYFEEMKG